MTIEDIELYNLALQRLENRDFSKDMSFEEVNKKFNITESDLKGWEDVKIE